MFEPDVGDQSDELEERQREALSAAISRSLKESTEGRTAPAEDILEWLRGRRES